MNGTDSRNGHPEDGQPLEEQLARCTPAGVPAELRGAVLHHIHRELRAARWDRRLGRVAAVLLAMGLGMSGLVHRLYPIATTGSTFRPTPQSIGRLAATVAEVTDVATARQFARQMAALQGWPAQGAEVEIIQRGFQRPRTQITPYGKDG